MQTRARDYSRGTRVVRETRPARTRTAPRRLRRGGPRMNPRPFPRANRPRAQLVAPHPRGRLRSTKPSFAFLDHSAETTLFGSVKAEINRGFAVQRESERRWAHHTVCSADLARSDWTVGKIPLLSGKKCVFGTETRCQIVLFAHKIFPKRRDSQKIPLFLPKHIPVCAENRGAK